MAKKSVPRRFCGVAGLIVLGVALACNAPLMGNPEEIPVTLTALAELEIETGVSDAVPSTPTPAVEAQSATPTPTLTVAPASGDDGSCVYGSAYVDDITVPDNAQIVTAQSFTKTWRLLNSGCLDWPDGTQLLFVDGDSMGGPVGVAVTPTPAGTTVDISVELTAPNPPGVYQGFWQLRSPDGLLFGERIYVLIETVPPPDTPTPSTSTGQPDLVIESVVYAPDPPLVDTDVSITVTVKNLGAAESGAAILQGEFEDNETPNESKAVPGLAPGAVHTAGFEVSYDAAGTYNIRFTIDANDQVEEQDENNNQSDEDVVFYKPEVYSSKALTITINSCADFDAGTVGCGGNEDVRWTQVNASTRRLEVRNGALIGLAGLAPVGYEGCTALPLSATPIDGGPGPDNELLTGSYLCLQTSEGRITQIAINGYGTNLMVGYTTWELSDSE